MGSRMSNADRMLSDRVFSHALNTVNKIRTGSQKPPSVTRLRLYGLYKQAMGTKCSRYTGSHG